jgi:hypothetical protein
VADSSIADPLREGEVFPKVSALLPDVEPPEHDPLHTVHVPGPEVVCMLENTVAPLGGVGSGDVAETVTVADETAPLQVTVYVVVLTGLTETVPLVALPVAVKFVPAQVEAFVLLHVRVEEFPLVMVVGLALSEADAAVPLGKA